MSYTINNISIVIPTYNRVTDLKITLTHLKQFSGKVKEIIVVDQSKNDLTKKMINRLKNDKIKYVYSNIPSITIARNLGVKNSSKKSKLICFIDDDVTLGKNFFEEILKVFNSYENAKAVAAYVNEAREREISNKFENFMKKIFFLAYIEKNRARMVSAYGNTYPIKTDKIINSQWLQGANMVYKKEIFDQQKFDENLRGYTIAEDTDFSYRVYLKYPNSIFITPFANFKHRCSQIERYPTLKMAYINQVDHFYLNFKDFNKNLNEKIIFRWSLFGIGLLRTLNLIIRPKKINYLKLKYFFDSLFYSIKNIEKIKQGKLREFMNNID